MHCGRMILDYSHMRASDVGNIPSKGLDRKDVSVRCAEQAGKFIPNIQTNMNVISPTWHV